MVENDKDNDEGVVDFDELVEKIKSGDYTQKELEIYIRILQTPPEHHVFKEVDHVNVWCLRHEIPVSRGYCRLERFNCEYFGNRCMGCQ